VTPLYLAIDQGGHASRAIVFDNTGQPVAQAFREIKTYYPATNCVEHDADALLKSVMDVVADVIAQLGSEAANIQSAGLATQRSSVVCWDSSGKPLTPVLSWQDRRAGQYLARLAPVMQEVRDRTGLFANPHYGASKIKWCLDHVTEVQQAHQRNHLLVGPLASFLLYRLLENKPFVTDPSNGGRTLLLNKETLDWDPFLCDLMAIDPQILPRCVATNYPFGVLKLNDYSIPLNICTGDQGAAIFAQGWPSSEEIYINAGTGAFVQRVLPDEFAVNPNMLTSVVYVSEASRIEVIEGTVNGAGKALDWLQTTLAITDFNEALRQAVRLDQETVIPIFLNGISGVGSPFWVSHMDSHFVGEQAEDSQKLVAVLESIVFLLTKNLNLMGHQNHGLVIYVTGGLSNIDLLCQKLSDLTGFAVQCPKIYEATAQGLAFLLANQGVSWEKNQLFRKKFVPNNNTNLQKRFLEWDNLMKNIR